MSKKIDDKAMLHLELPAQQRKQPRQSRSIALVDALKKAARELLEKEGREALSLQRLADYSGVAASSIYEYFPALDALVIAVFDDYWDELLESLFEQIEHLPKQATLYDGVTLIVSEILAMRDRQVQLDPEVGIQYLRYGELRRLDLVTSSTIKKSGATHALMIRFADEIQSKNLEKLEYLALQMIQALFRIIALEKPEYLKEKDTTTLISRMLWALLTSPAE